MSHHRYIVLLMSLLYFDTTIAEAKLPRKNGHHRCRRLRHDERTNHRQSPIKSMKRRRTICSANEDDFLSMVTDESLANSGQTNRKQQDANIIRSPRKKRSLTFLSGSNHLYINKHKRTSQSASAAAAFVSNHPHFKLKQSSQQSQLTITRPLLPTISTTLSSTTSLHLKFKTFEEMINHHHSTPLLIDFYSPFCGPCKLMKGEIMSIRHELDALGPTVGVQDEQVKEEEEEEEEEDCSVEDNIALSNDCLEDGYLEEQQDGVGIDDDDDDDDDGGRGALSSSMKEDTTLLLNDLLPAPPPSTTTTTTTTSEQQQQHTQSTKQHTTTTTNTPSGIPVYHVNTNKFPQVGAKNHISGLPTLVLFYRGEELWRNEGLMKGEEILNVLVELQEGGWEKKIMVKEKSGRKEVEDVVVIHGEEVDNMTKKKKKRKGRRLGG